MTRRITLAQRARYRFDNTLARGTIALIAWLFVASAVFVLLMSLFVVVTGADETEEGHRLGLPEMIWRSLLRTLDPGTMGGDQGNGVFLGSMLVVTLGGIFLVSTLIGILTSGIEGKIGELRRGRSFVVEAQHTLILGWSPQIFSIISELVIANANQPRSCIVILAPMDKLEMEEEIRAKVGSTGRTRIVCRTGNPLELTDLEIVNPHAARSIILLAPETSDPDTHVIKTILALTNNPNRRPEPYQITAEIRDRRNLQVAQMVAGEEARLVLVSDLLARIIAQTCRQSGLSVVYTELLDFAGDEIYFHDEPGLVGKAFGQALVAYEDSAVIGLRLAGGRVQLKPPMETPIATGDKIIAISEDDDTIRLSPMTPAIDEPSIVAAPPQKPGPERTLILGWNRGAPTIIRELDHYVAPGSETQVVADIPAAAAAVAALEPDLANQNVAFHAGDTTDRATLDSLDIPGFDHVITLSYSDELDVQAADARTLITLLHLRDLGEKTGRDLAIVSEMLDLRNRELAEVTHADDFIVSNKLVSLMLSQISENRELEPVFRDLFDPEGAELYLRPASDYVQLHSPLTFYTIVEAARRRDEIAIGYRLRAQANDATRSYGVKVNPRKSEAVAFGEGDRIIVLAEE